MWLSHLCPTRHYEKFKAAFLERVNGLTVADPLSDKAEWALSSKEHMEKVLSYIELAKEEGGTLLTGGIGYS